MIFDSIGVNPILDLCKSSPNIPLQTDCGFMFLEPLELFDQVEFEFRAQP
jgi:hypothetical protein